MLTHASTLKEVGVDKRKPSEAINRRAIDRGPQASARSAPAGAPSITWLTHQGRACERSGPERRLLQLMSPLSRLISLGPPEGLRRHAFDHRVSSATSRSSVRRSASIAIERASPPRAHRLPRRRQACVFAKMRIPQGCTSNPQGLHVAFVCARCLLPRCGSCGRCCSPCSLPRHGPPARGPAAAGRVMEKVGPTAGRETEIHSGVGKPNRGVV
jgi:hypothetical protein